MTDVLWQLQSIDMPGRLTSVDLTIAPGVTAVIGPSGAGKTTLLNLLVGFERPARGTIQSNLDPADHHLPLFWSPPDGGLWAHLSAADHLHYVSSDAKRNAALLDDFDLAHRADAKPAALSQGERSRLAVARALAADAAALVMDEPLAHVDPSRLDRYWAALRRHSADASLVFATHDPRRVLAEADHVICLAEGRVTYAGDVDTLYHHPPTEALARALGDANWLPGDPPRCLRPHAVTIEPDEAGTYTVVSSRFEGEVTRSELKDNATGDTRTWLHRPAALDVGMHVKIIMLLLAALLIGCDGGKEPMLQPADVSIWNVPNDGPSIPAPRSVTVTDDDRSVVVDNAGRVMVYSPQGKVIRQWRMPTNENGNAEGTCVLRDGRIAVADTHYHRVIFFTPEGEVESMFGRRGEGPGEFIYPVAVAQDSDGNLYVGEYGGNDRIQKFAPDGTHLLTFGGHGGGAGEFQRASGMIIHDDELYVADAMNNRVQVFDLTGNLLRILGGENCQLHYPYDVCVSPSDDLYVVEYGSGRITRMSVQGELKGRFGRTGRKVGEFATPWGIGIGKSGRLRVADTGNRRIVELTF